VCRVRLYFLCDNFLLDVFISLSTSCSRGCGCSGCGCNYRDHLAGILIEHLPSRRLQSKISALIDVCYLAVLLGWYDLIRSVGALGTIGLAAHVGRVG